MSYFGRRDNPLLHCCATEPLRLGRAQVLRELPGGALVRENGANLHILAADSKADAEALLLGAGDIDFIMLCNADFAPLIEGYRLNRAMYLHQAAYFKPSPPPADPRLRIALPDGRAFARILQTYHMDTPEDLRNRLECGELFFARDMDGADVGFVGLHPEGCFGMVEVFPEQRGHGYGKALEAHIIRFCLESGRLPYCQVELDNRVSINLQRAMGLEISPETLLMARRTEEA